MNLKEALKMGNKLVDILSTYDLLINESLQDKGIYFNNKLGEAGNEIRNLYNKEALQLIKSELGAKIIDSIDTHIKMVIAAAGKDTGLCKKISRKDEECLIKIYEELREQPIEKEYKELIQKYCHTSWIPENFKKTAELKNEHLEGCIINPNGDVIIKPDNGDVFAIRTVFPNFQSKRKSKYNDDLFSLLP